MLGGFYYAFLLSAYENRIEYYLKRLENLNVSYIVYHFDSKKELLTEKYKYEGSYHKETKNNKNCLICKGIRGYEEDKYIIAVQKLLEKDVKENEN